MRVGTDVAKAVRAHQPGQQVTVVVRRGGTQRSFTLTTAASGGHAVIGISTTDRNVYPFTVRIGLKNVGGPSAGLMFALGIIEKLTPGD